MDLKELLPLLVASKVSKFKSKDYEIEFTDTSGVPAAEAIQKAMKAEEDKLPPDLRGDDLMSQDKVLNWSAPPSPDDGPPLPLTGEEPLLGDEP